tara:strand:- start:338 stop:1135 length:798 start_codon:yes stop_codon:yes gene_type:complete
MDATDAGDCTYADAGYNCDGTCASGYTMLTLSYVTSSEDGFTFSVSDAVDATIVHYSTDETLFGTDTLSACFDNTLGEGCLFINTEGDFDSWNLDWIGTAGNLNLLNSEDLTSNYIGDGCSFGCTDTAACNYDESALIDDGLCSYYGNPLEVETSCVDENGETGYYNSECNCGDWTSINESSSMELIMYPNPVSGVLNIEFTSVSNTHVTIQFVNTLGQVVTSNNYMLTNGLLDIKLNTNEYSKGLYHVNLISNNKMVNRTILVE